MYKIFVDFDGQDGARQVIEDGGGSNLEVT